MLHFTRWKQIAIVLSVLVGIAFVVPSFFAKETVANWPWFVPHQQISLGLDLRGGAHLLLSMETADVRKDWLDTLRDDARRRLRDAKIGISSVGISNGAIQVRLAKIEDSDAALKELRGLAQQTGDLIRGFAGTDLDVRKAEGGVIVITPTEACSIASPMPSVPPSRPCAGASTSPARRKPRSSARAATASWCRCLAFRTPHRSRS
jgi:preprotein translocase subunit SecD